MGHSVVFEPSYRHRSNYIDYHTYEGLVTVDEHTASSGSFDIIMTNNSNRYVKVTRNQTLGMLQYCDSDQICTIHRIVTFESKPFERGGIKPKPLEKVVTNPNHSKNINIISSINTQPVSGNTSETQNMIKDNKTKIPTVAKDFYRIPTRNKHGEIEVNKITDTAFEEEFVSHKKPKLQDAPIDQRTKQELEQLLGRNKDCFPEDERQIGTTPLITRSIDTGDHPPVAKRPYTVALKHHDWVKAEIDKLLEAGVIRESDSSWSAPVVVVPKGDGGKRLCIDFRA